MKTCAVPVVDPLPGLVAEAGAASEAAVARDTVAARPAIARRRVRGVVTGWRVDGTRPLAYTLMRGAAVRGAVDPPQWSGERSRARTCARLARQPPAARCVVERAEHQLRGVRPRGDGRRAVPVRRGGRRHRGGDPLHADRADPRHLARRRARAAGRPALRVPRRRPLGAGPGPDVQPRQAAARPLRPRGQRLGGPRRPDLRLPAARRPRARPGARRPARAALRGRLRAVRPALGGRARRLRLGRRRPGPAAHAVDRHDHLRAARQGLHADPPGGARGAARDLRRADHGRRRALPQGPRRHHRRAAAGAPERPGARPRRGGADQLLGLQLDRLLRPAQRLQLGRRHRPAGHASSRRWSRRCTPPASR